MISPVARETVRQAGSASVDNGIVDHHGEGDTGSSEAMEEAPGWQQLPVAIQYE